MKQISIIGLGYIGLPTAILAAQSGYKVFGFDTNKQKIEEISLGVSPIVETGIIQKLFSVISDKSLQVFHEIQPADCFVVAVPTPFEKASKKADLSYVFDAANMVAKKLKHGDLVILESTVPVGTTSKLANFLQNISGLKLGLDFFVAHCPERVLPGKIFQELVDNDRVIGGICQYSCELAKKFYSKITKGHFYLTDDKTAEMVKLVENGSRDAQIAFANTVDLMCEQAGINSRQVIEIANKHPRVNILNPNCGVGGHCIAVDPWFLIESFSATTNFLKQVRDVNDKKPYFVIDSVFKKIEKLKEKNVVIPKVLVLGLTFKADVDDIRESPALKITKELNNQTNLLELAICEPKVNIKILQNLGFNKILKLQDGIVWADLILILVDHSEFKLLKKIDLKNKEVIDTCGLLYKLDISSSDILLSKINNVRCEI
ncbi:nucleotide sugar dehydrogenase [Candidatus Babeliales bacterium]|nr:nucleotide sugar dehydrogenase [Candidatus Babeliales bacterium]MCF7899791.1 nucleotide sugar dehydrogenase [Candidatus Babeliales bacterium]